MTTLIDIFVPLLVVLVMTIVGMDLRWEDFARVRQYPLLVPAAVLGQWLLVTVVAGLVGRLLELPPAVAGGALLVAAAPVATLSNYYAQLARGHLALAVTVAAVSNVLAVLVTPVVANAGSRLFLDASSTFELPLGRVAQQSFLGLLLPLLAGMLIRDRAARWAQRWRSRLQLLALLAIVALFSFIVFSQFAVIRDQLAVFLAASFLFTVAMLGVGTLAAWLLTRRGEERRALLWGFPARNVAVAMLLAAGTIRQNEMASFVAVLFATQIALLLPIAYWLGLRHNR